MRLPVLARIDRYTDAAVVLIPLDDRVTSGPVTVPSSIVAVTLVGHEFWNGIVGPYELTEMTDELLAVAGNLMTVIAWLPDWKVTELGLPTMAPEVKP